MTAMAPLALPGLDGATVLLTRAASPVGVAQALVLLASGADVLAVDADTTRPGALRDAGTGLPGHLHYRGTGGGWAAIADWIGETNAGLTGAVLNDDPLDDALRPHLRAGAAIVAVGREVTVEGCRCNAVEIPDGLEGVEAERAAAVIAFLLSTHARAISGARIPLRP
jgi:hypothetical protein